MEKELSNILRFMYQDCIFLYGYDEALVRVEFLKQEYENIPIAVYDESLLIELISNDIRNHFVVASLGDSERALQMAFDFYKHNFIGKHGLYSPMFINTQIY